MYYQSEFVKVPVYVAFRKLEFLESLISISCRDFLNNILHTFTGCFRLTCYRSYQRSLYCVVIYENYCNMDSLTRYVARHFRIVLLPCSRKKVIKTVHTAWTMHGLCIELYLYKHICFHNILLVPWFIMSQWWVRISFPDKSPYFHHSNKASNNKSSC